MPPSLSLLRHTHFQSPRIPLPSRLPSLPERPFTAAPWTCDPESDLPRLSPWTPRLCLLELHILSSRTPTCASRVPTLSSLDRHLHPRPPRQTDRPPVTPPTSKFNIPIPFPATSAPMHDCPDAGILRPMGILKSAKARLPPNRRFLTEVARPSPSFGDRLCLLAFEPLDPSETELRLDRPMRASERNPSTLRSEPRVEPTGKRLC